LDDLLAAPIPRLSLYSKKLKVPRHIPSLKTPTPLLKPNITFFCQAILKETPTTHPDYEDLNQAFSLTRKIKQQVKAKYSTAKNRQLILEAKRRTTTLLPVRGLFGVQVLWGLIEGLGSRN